NLYTVKENLFFKANSNIEGQVSYIALYLDQKPKLKGTTVELSMENVPAFESEEYMPPEDNYKSEVLFFYLDREASTADKFWQNTGKTWHTNAERILGNHKEVKEAA